MTDLPNLIDRIDECIIKMRTLCMRSTIPGNPVMYFKIMKRLEERKAMLIEKHASLIDLLILATAKTAIVSREESA